MSTPRVVSVKPFAITINGQVFFVRAKTKTAAINTALDRLNIEALQLGADEILARGLTSEDFFDAQ